jgi:5-methylcytosine-specific restriction endonuclease McrA
MSLIDRAVLVVNATYEPLEITPARNALKKIVKKKAVIELREGDQDVYPGIPLPSVIRLVEYRRVPEHMTKLSKKNFYLRDHYHCQYCGERFEPRDLTLDHVIPKSRGGPSSWENMVTCCKGCNRRKGSKTLTEAGMNLLHRPKPLTVHTSRHLMRRLGMDEDERWGTYLYA